MVPGFVSHLGFAWEAPEYAHYFRRLASFCRLICIDKRGTGMSDPVPVHALPTLEQRMDDLRVVMDAVGSKQAVVYGVSEGGQMAALFAATYPERTGALVLYGTYARLRSAPDYPPGYPDEVLEAFGSQQEATWGEITEPNLYAISAARDPRFKEFLGRYAQHSASPGAAATLNRMNYDMDVRPVLPVIGVPTLVLHRVDDPLISVEHARYLAGHIPGAKYVELPGDDHLFFAGDTDRLVDEIEVFLTGHRSAPHPDRVLATVLFTDIVGSTQQLSTVGDRAWRSLLDRHESVVASELARYRGRQVKSTGDGVLATFDGPARAIHCATAIRDALGSAGLDIRAGVHTGEIEVMDHDIAGIAVHVAARVTTLANTGEVLVSSTVKDLVAGSGVVFVDRGIHDLKGVSDKWRLFAVTN
jgi:class 3 adenylate cyclase